MGIREYQYLSEEQRAHFLEHGWVCIPDAIPPEHIKAWTENVWVRLGFDPNDKSTWTKEMIHMPVHREMPTKEFTSKGWGAICELVGGEDRIDTTLFNGCGDSLICNLGSPEWEHKTIHPRDLGAWHFDGDWFRHYLDSGDQAITVLHLYNDIVPNAGGTYVAPDALKDVIRWLHSRPEGTDDSVEGMDPKVQEFVNNAIRNTDNFVEMTGKAGDIVLMHALMPHSSSKNHLRIPRFITNPPVVLKGPLNLNREDPAEYSLCELKILNTLGVDSLPDWNITRPRMRWTSRSRPFKDALVLEELERLKSHAAKTGGTVNSIHVHGQVEYQITAPTIEVAA